MVLFYTKVQSAAEFESLQRQVGYVNMQCELMAILYSNCEDCVRIAPETKIHIFQFGSSTAGLIGLPVLCYVYKSSCHEFRVMHSLPCPPTSMKACRQRNRDAASTFFPLTQTSYPNQIIFNFKNRVSIQIQVFHKLCTVLPTLDPTGPPDSFLPGCEIKIHTYIANSRYFKSSLQRIPR